MCTPATFKSITLSIEDAKFSCWCARAHLQDGKIDEVLEQLDRAVAALDLALVEAKHEV